MIDDATKGDYRDSLAILWPGLPHDDAHIQVDHDVVQAAERRLEVWKRYVQGQSYEQIAKELRDKGIECTLGTLRSDIHHVLDSFRLRAEQHAAVHVARELARLEVIEAGLWEAWQRSCQPRTRTRSGARKTSGTIYSTAENTRESRDGNPNFMRLLIDCWEKRCRLLGILRTEQQNQDKDKEPEVKYITGVAPEDMV